MAKNLCDTSPQGRMGSQPTASNGTSGRSDNYPTDVRKVDIPRGGAINVPLSSAGANPKTRQNETGKKDRHSFRSRW